MNGAYGGTSTIQYERTEGVEKSTSARQFMKRSRCFANNTQVARQVRQHGHSRFVNSDVNLSKQFAKVQGAKDHVLLSKASTRVPIVDSEESHFVMSADARARSSRMQSRIAHRASRRRQLDAAAFSR